MDINKIKKLQELNILMMDCKDWNTIIEKGTKLIKEIIDVDRMSIFLYEHNNNLVWTYQADELGKVVFSADYGIVGWVVKNREIKVVNDTSKDENFYSDVDKETGYVTRNILAIPIFDVRKDKLLGVIELLNKDGDFTKKDIAVANMFSNYLSESFEKLREKYK